MCATARFRHRPLQRKLSDILGYLLSNTLPGLLPHVDVLVLLGLLLPGGLLQVLGYNVRVGLGELLSPLLLLVLLGEEVVEVCHDAGAVEDVLDGVAEEKQPTECCKSILQPPLLSF